MRTNTTIDTETNPLREVASGMPGDHTDRRPGFIERWLNHNLNAFALAITAAAFVARILAARTTYFNPDKDKRKAWADQFSPKVIDRLAEDSSSYL